METGTDAMPLLRSVGRERGGAWASRATWLYIGSSSLTRTELLLRPKKSRVNLTNATAIGALAQVTQNNSLVLGSINGVNGASANTQVGIGTTAPKAKLEVTGGNILVGSPGQASS